MQIKALIFGAGRGKRMRPLTDTVPKPLLKYRGIRLVDWQINALAKAGIHDFVINTAHLAGQFPTTLGTGEDRGIRIRYSQEGTSEEQALESLGGIAKALPLLSPDGRTPFIAVAGDIVTDFDYRRLLAHADALANGTLAAHLVLVPNPAFHSEGDMALRDGMVLENPKELTFSSIGIYSPSIFAGVAPERAKLFPWLFQFCRGAKVSGELFNGEWHNIGTPEQLLS